MPEHLRTYKSLGTASHFFNANHYAFIREGKNDARLCFYAPDLSIITTEPLSNYDCISDLTNPNDIAAALIEHTLGNDAHASLTYFSIYKKQVLPLITRFENLTAQEIQTLISKPTTEQAFQVTYQGYQPWLYHLYAKLSTLRQMNQQAIFNITEHNHDPYYNHYSFSMLVEYAKSEINLLEKIVTILNIMNRNKARFTPMSFEDLKNAHIFHEFYNLSQFFLDATPVYRSQLEAHQVLDKTNRGFTFFQTSPNTLAIIYKVQSGVKVFNDIQYDQNASAFTFKVDGRVITTSNICGSELVLEILSAKQDISQHFYSLLLEKIILNFTTQLNQLATMPDPMRSNALNAVELDFMTTQLLRHKSLCEYYTYFINSHRSQLLNLSEWSEGKIQRDLLKLQESITQINTQLEYIRNEQNILLASNISFDGSILPSFDGPPADLEIPEFDDSAYWIYDASYSAPTTSRYTMFNQPTAPQQTQTDLEEMVNSFFA